MGWFGRRKRDSEDANEVLRRYNEAEAARLMAMASGDAAPHAGRLPVSDTGAGELSVEDVFTITGRGQIATGTVARGTIRVGDAVAVFRDGAGSARTVIADIEMFRRRADEASEGAMVGLLLRERIDVTRGDVIRVIASA
jgi:translation elongation factor EF-Tu-like GTPase